MEYKPNGYQIFDLRDLDFSNGDSEDLTISDYQCLQELATFMEKCCLEQNVTKQVRLSIFLNHRYSSIIVSHILAMGGGCEFYCMVNGTYVLQISYDKGDPDVISFDLHPISE